jgi:hypothetical protein
MHIEVLVEDSSGAALLRILLPSLLGPWGEVHTWNLHSYKGVGRVPTNLRAGDPAKRILLDQLPRILGGYANTPGIDAVVVVLDTDRHDCRAFLTELNQLASDTAPDLRVLFRLAIEEIEAWYFGDRDALLRAYPRAKRDVLGRYVQDSVCGTWEMLADAVYPGGCKAVAKVGWPLPGQLKHEWATTIGPLLRIDDNNSASFGKLRDGVRRLAAQPPESTP